MRCKINYRILENQSMYYTRKIIFYRARIHEMTEDNSEVVSVICIDKGTIEKVTKDDRIRPLYSQFRTNLDNALVPYKLRDVQVSNVFITSTKQYCKKIHRTSLNF